MLAARGLSPLHRLGQNFLHDHNILRKLVDASGVKEGDLVVEIGPGTGTLTEELLHRGCRVIVCELDSGLADIIDERIGQQVELIRGDCLQQKKLNPEVVDAIGDDKWTLVSNLPYQIASPLIIELLANHPLCNGQFITIQYEVALRLLSKVDGKEWGVLSILAQRLADIAIITKVPNSCFWPKPKIQSACISVIPKDNINRENASDFAKFVTSLFSKRRKQIGSIVGRSIQWPEGVTDDVRPSTLTIHQLEALMEVVRISSN